jgi:hypothetical protein
MEYDLMNEYITSNVCLESLQCVQGCTAGVCSDCAYVDVFVLVTVQ